MTWTINNGRRADVVFGRYSGRAGVVDHEGKTEVAFAEDSRRLRGVTTGTIDGTAYRVVSIEDSKLIKGMVSLLVEPA